LQSIGIKNHDLTGNFLIVPSLPGERKKPSDKHSDDQDVKKEKRRYEIEFDFFGFVPEQFHPDQCPEGSGCCREKERSFGYPRAFSLGRPFVKCEGEERDPVAGRI
jgi:hypothetical protein